MKRKLLVALVILGLLGSFFSFSTLAGEHPSKARGGIHYVGMPIFSLYLIKTSLDIGEPAISVHSRLSS